MDMLVLQSSEKPQYLNKLAKYKSRNNNFVYRAVDVVFQLLLAMIFLGGWDFEIRCPVVQSNQLNVGREQNQNGNAKEKQTTW